MGKKAPKNPNGNPVTKSSPPPSPAEDGAAAAANGAPALPDAAIDGFSTLGLDERILRSLTELGYEEPTPIQREAIPPLLAGRDLVGQAATGTGKTAAFALPLLQLLAGREGERVEPTALVLVPTRELAMQVAEAVHRYGRPLRVRVVPIYGGQSFGQQLRALSRGVDVVVATPGRALDHINRGTLKLDSLGVVVLDEADEMLDMGFAEDLEAILEVTPKTRQTVLFSATMPARINAIAKRYLTDPVRISIAREKLPEGVAPKIRQTAYIVARAHKLAALGRVLDLESPTAGLVFCRTRNEVDELSETLSSRGYNVEPLHGGLSQEQRDRVMKKLRGGAADLVIATDVAARGLDIEQLTHVINFNVPCAPESYVHRIGRVGRAGREGVAITLAEPREHRLLRNIEQLTKQKIDIAKVPTVADLRARRLESTRASLREAVVEGGLDPYRVAVESLAGEFDIMDVAAAAVKMLHMATGQADVDDEGDIPTVEPYREEPWRAGRPAMRGGDHPPRRAPFARPERGPERGPARGEQAKGGVTRLFIGLGRDAGIRPQDLVGAITGEAGIPGRMIGAIDIADRFSLVEIPEELAAEVTESLRKSTIKGRKVVVRQDRTGG
ncbi:MAG TPA: DEAD/DEAH box helicase [Polyangiaceae bacterium]|nr:DEAD/DEAH box helicase [Polyangiaceae bacterium]